LKKLFKKLNNFTTSTTYLKKFENSSSYSCFQTCLIMFGQYLENDNNRKEDACCCHKAAKIYKIIEESK